MSRYHPSVATRTFVGVGSNSAQSVTTEAELARREARDYEPASEFLARIQASREQKSNNQPKRKLNRSV